MYREYTEDSLGIAGVKITDGAIKDVVLRTYTKDTAGISNVKISAGDLTRYVIRYQNWDPEEVEISGVKITGGELS